MNTAFEFIAATLAQGCLLRRYYRQATTFGNEATFKWLKYHNSKSEEVKLFFNVSDEEHEKIMLLIFNSLNDGENPLYLLT